MDTPSPAARELAERLLAIEAANTSEGDAHMPEVARVCEKLRISLTRFAGAEAFASLLRRSLALARMEVPSLRSFTVEPAFSIDALKAVTEGEADAGTEASAAIIAHLLGLLVTFIGEPLTLRLVRESWPDVSPGKLH